MSDDLTPEELDLYRRAWGTNRPATTGPAPLAFRETADGQIVRDRADRALLAEFPRSHQLASIVCARSGRRRVIGLVVPALVVTVGDGIAEWGADLEVECRCGLVHAVDGQLLSDVVAGLPARMSGRVPVVDVRTVERSAT